MHNEDRIKEDENHGQAKHPEKKISFSRILQLLFPFYFWRARGIFQITYVVKFHT